ncbi:MAG: hypothetical protein ACHQXK_06380 [Methanosarcina thermophila]|nr:hypothetical protein [Methanosarcina thermophila]NLU58130.1 hypothetical protein [Methanosarcina thermophila]HOA70066.1 hypothetical protein [Methanosarcina thermophila]HOQ66786.1 hypothetical protein [Methanosarcina thermophila]HPT81927.1 hypothetical protein [Methanosarcina thermophila]HPZ21222.1 hypothetical protein [Methanosarcina thermophila]
MANFSSTAEDPVSLMFSIQASMGSSTSLPTFFFTKLNVHALLCDLVYD